MKPAQNCHVIQINKKSTGKLTRVFYGLSESKAIRTYNGLKLTCNDDKYSVTLFQKYIIIKKCPLHFLWYHDQINQAFPFLGSVKADNRSRIEYKTKTNSNRTNFVDPDHCELVESHQLNIESEPVELPEIKYY